MQLYMNFMTDRRIGQEDEKVASDRDDFLGVFT